MCDRLERETSGTNLKACSSASIKDALQKIQRPEPQRVLQIYGVLDCLALFELPSKEPRLKRQHK